MVHMGFLDTRVEIRVDEMDCSRDSDNIRWFDKVTELIRTHPSVGDNSRVRVHPPNVAEVKTRKEIRRREVAQ